MGLSIHYSGAFKQGASLASLIEEVKDIAEVYNWQHHIYNDKFIEEELGKKEYSDEIYGISFTPPNCETVSIEFLSNGKMSSTMHLQLYGKETEESQKDYLYMLFVKTQYAGIEIHKLLIHLFKYLSEKYFTNFTMMDEGKYWETGDEKLLQEIFTRYTDLIDSFSASLEIYPKNKNENFKTYFDRLMNQIQKRRKK